MLTAPLLPNPHLPKGEQAYERTQTPWSTQGGVTSTMSITRFSPNDASDLQCFEDSSRLQQAIENFGDAPPGSTHLITFIDYVDQPVLSMLQESLHIAPTLLQHVNSDAEMHSAGCSILIASPSQGVPEQVCMSFGAPLVESDNVHSIDLARMRIHLVLIKSTVVMFTKFAGIKKGLFSQRSSQFSALLGSGNSSALMRTSSESGLYGNSMADKSVAAIHRMVFQIIEQDSGKFAQMYGPDAWFLFTALLWAIEKEHYETTAKAQSDSIDAIFHRMMRGNSKANSQQLADHVYTLLQRSNVILMLANSFSSALDEILTEETEKGFMQGVRLQEFEGQGLVRGDLQSILLAVKCTVQEFESHVSMMMTVTEMWSKRSEMLHVQVNTLLAMVAAIFLPLTFLCGVYGMNFNTHSGTVAIPLLSLGEGFGGYMTYWGMCIMFIIALLLLFIRTGWFTLCGFSHRTAFKIVGISLFISLCLVTCEALLWSFDVDDVRTPESGKDNPKRQL